MIADPRSRIRVHSQDSCLREQSRDLICHALRTDAERGDAFGAARRAFRHDRRLKIAIVTA